MKESTMGLQLEQVAKQLVAGYSLIFKERPSRKLPSADVIVACLDELFHLVFPLGDGNQDTESVLERLDSCFNSLQEQAELAFAMKSPAEGASLAAQRAVEHLFSELARIQKWAQGDIAAAFDRDPASKAIEEIIIAYPGIKAITVYRIAHELLAQGVPLIPRIMSEHIHSITGIDIHPGATIGKNLFIDHGTGVVIGETSIIGDSVTLYQGVTLGALAPAKGQSLRGVKRHPTVEDRVTIYAEATLLGDITIGAGSTIGGNVWLKESVPPATRVVVQEKELICKTCPKINKGVQ